VNLTSQPDDRLIIGIEYRTTIIRMGLV
jgi:hypothetical protein